MTNEEPQSKSPTPAGPNFAAWFSWLRWAIFASVVVAIVWLVINSADQLKEADFRWQQVGWLWWGGAIVAYIAAMSLGCTFWHLVLQRFGQAPVWSQSIVAFFTSQLGKYVPGKAMVVVIRTDMIRGAKVATAPAVASVFVETLTWIFVGAAIASVFVPLQFEAHTGLTITAVTTTVIAGMLTWPSIFKAIARKIMRGKLGKRVSVFDGLNLTTMYYGWFVMSIAWMLNAASLWLVLKGLVGAEIQSSDFSLALVCVTLATVAGFVSPLPGGLGVRELVMIPLLGSRFGPATAIIAAVVIRLVWLASELIAFGIIRVGSRIHPPSNS